MGGDSTTFPMQTTKVDSWRRPSKAEKQKQLAYFRLLKMLLQHVITISSSTQISSEYVNTRHTLITTNRDLMKPKPKKQKIKRTTKSKVEVRSGKPETRSYKSTRLEVRKSASGAMQLAGTAIVFGNPSQDLGGFTEICSYEAVQNSLKRNADCYMLWQHDSSQPLARVKTGTLELTLNRAGLDFVATLNSSPLAQNAFQAVKDGTVDSVTLASALNPMATSG